MYLNVQAQMAILQLQMSLYYEQMEVTEGNDKK